MNLEGLHPEAAEPIRTLVEVARQMGFSPYVISTLRTCEQQGHTQSKVSGCHSWHTLGRAVDLELHDPVTGRHDERQPYEDLADWWESVGGTWGGGWTSSYPDGLIGFENAGPGDVVHYQWTEGMGGVPDSICDPAKTCEQNVADYFARAGAVTGAPFPLPGPPSSADDPPRPRRWLGPLALTVGALVPLLLLRRFAP